MARKNRRLAAVLAIILGSFGVHKFYMGNVKKGILYLLFFWTFIPTVLGVYSGIRYLLMDDEKFQEKYFKSDEDKDESSDESDALLVYLLS